MKLLKTYGFSLLLIISILAGLLIGRTLPDTARYIRPVGDLFLNIIFMIIVPLVFFTVSSAIASTAGTHRLSRVSWSMAAVFIGTSIVAAATSVMFMAILEPTPGAGIVLKSQGVQVIPGFLDQLVRAFTTADFPELLSRRSMLPLILFSMAVGLATVSLGNEGAPFARFLSSGAQVFTKLIDYALYLAPAGLLAWFAATVVDTGDAVATAYVNVFIVYYTFGAAYFFVAFSLYAFLAGRMAGVGAFWKEMLQPSLTALGTCSSMATMPVNLESAQKMGVPSQVCNVVIPVGAALHKDGSVIGGVVKVLFAMSLFHQELTLGRMVIAAGIAILVGVVVGAIPSGGMMGEMLIISVFGFPPETLPLLAAISVIIDPLATLLNATGDNVAAMLVTRFTAGNIWKKVEPRERYVGS